MSSEAEFFLIHTFTNTIKFITFVIMIKQGDIFQYTAEIGGHTKYYVDEVYETMGEIIVMFSWDEDGTRMQMMNRLEQLENTLQTGHIKLVGTDDYKPITHIRPHSFNPILRNIPIRPNRLICPYRTPKLFEFKF